FTNIDMNASEPMGATSTVYQIRVDSPFYAQYGVLGSSATEPGVDFGSLPATDAKAGTPNLFTATAVDQFGLKSLPPFMRTIQVVPRPSWLQSETLPAQSIDSSITYDPSKYQYTLTSHAVILNLQTTIDELVNANPGIALVGDLNNQLLAE